jgi:protein involved in polysaccharide export with SLBB domain
MPRKLLFIIVVLCSTQVGYAQFAKRSFAPQVATELSPAEAQKMRESINGQKNRMTTNAVEPNNTILRALQNELDRVRDSVASDKIRRKAPNGAPLDSSTQVASLEVFGAEFFKNEGFSFAPSENFPTPDNYVVGPGDVIDLVIYGYQETEMELKVSPEGNVNIPFGGVIQVSGLALSEVEQRIKLRMSRNGYQTLNSGESKLKLSISKIRSISVYLVGAENPGKYSIPSVSGVMHALYVAGGPMAQGSYRSIELVRNGKVYQVIDLYDFMFRGRSIDDVVLKNNDVIRIPFFDRRIILDGAFKRPAIYELKSGETFRDAISFAGGLTDDAFTGHLFGTRYDSTRGVVHFNLVPVDWDQVPQSGDQLTARALDLPPTQFAVVEGAVFNPGMFGWLPNMSVDFLLRSAGGVRPDAFEGRGLIVRSPLGKGKQYLMFSMDSELASIDVEQRDTLLIFSNTAFISPQKIHVLGEVREPGEFTFGEGLSLADALALARGFTDKATKGIVVVSRSIRSSSRLAQVLSITVDSSLMITSGEFKLRPNDVIMVRPNPEVTEQRFVTLEGEWMLPGVYSLQSRNDRLRNLYTQAKGLTAFADPNGLIILRATKVNPKSPSPTEAGYGKDDIPLSVLHGDSTMSSSLLQNKDRLEEVERIDTIALNIRGRYSRGLDFVLQRGDRVIAQEQLSSVHISGAVNQPTYVMHQPGRRARHYVRASGGFESSALKTKTYVRLANGRTRSVLNLGVIRIYPRVPQGSKVVVPIDPKFGLDDQKIDPAQIAVVTSLLGFLSTTTIAILQLIQ